MNISNVYVKLSGSNSQWSIVQAISNGDTVLFDDNSFFESIPYYFRRSLFLKISNDLKNETNGTVISFKVDCNSFVYVAHSDSIAQKPDWLLPINGWEDTDLDIKTQSNGLINTFSVFKKNYSKDEDVLLGSNGSSTKKMYIVLIKSQAIDYYKKEGVFVYCNNPEQIIDTDLIDQNLDGPLLLNEQIPAGKDIMLWMFHSNKTGQIIRPGVKIYNADINPANVNIMNIGWYDGSEPNTYGFDSVCWQKFFFGKDFNGNTVNNPGVITLPPSSSESINFEGKWLFNGTGSPVDFLVSPDKIFSIALKFSSDKPLLLKLFAYSDENMLTDFPPLPIHEQRSRGPGHPPESRTYKGQSSVLSEVEESFLFTLNDSLPSNSNLNVTLKDTAGQDYLSESFITNITKKSDLAGEPVVINDMLGFIFYDRFGNTFNFDPEKADVPEYGTHNLGNWGVLYRHLFTFLNEGNKERTLRVLMSNPLKYNTDWINVQVLSSDSASIESIKSHMRSVESVFEDIITLPAKSIVDKSISFFIPGNTGGGIKHSVKLVRKVIIFQVENENFYVDWVEKEIDPGRGTKPVIKNSRMLVPVRAPAEELGGIVGWQANEMKVTIEFTGENNVNILINLWIGDKTIVVKRVSPNGTIQESTIEMDIAPEIINARTFVPVRFLSENLGGEVNWYALEKEAVIYFDGLY